MMLNFHTSKSWNVPHELPNSLFYDTGTMGDHARLEGEEHLDLNEMPSPTGLVAARIGAYEGGREHGSKSAPSSPRIGPADFPINNISKSKTLTQKRKKRLPDYVTFSKGSSRNLSVSSPSLNEVEPEKKKDSLERGVTTSKDSSEATLLKTKLTGYSMYGLPRLSRDIRLYWEIREGNETSIRLENSWRDIIRGHENMSLKSSHQQEAIWELLCTELSYMKKLRIITDLVICTLINLHDAGFLNEIRPEYLFSNIPHIIRAHRCFWQEVISPVLEQARRSHQPFDPLSLQEGFQTFPERFHAYIQYCLEVTKKMEFGRVQYKDNELFRVFVSWVEKHKQSHRLRLSDMLMRPHQRITKYSLLLQAILKRTEDQPTRESLTSMVASVERFLQHINTQMQRGEDYDKLHSTMDRIGAYEVLEPGSEEIEKQIKAFSRLDLSTPILGVGPHNIRRLLKEGSLKMKDGKEAKAEVHGFLFTDTFLITKMHRKTDLAKVIRSPLMLEKILCRPLRDLSCFLLIYLNEFRCVVSALSFQCSSADVCKEWIDKFSYAQGSLKKLKAEEFHRQEQERQALFLATDPQSDLMTSDTRSLSHWSDDTTQDSRSQSEFLAIVPHLVITEDNQAPEREGTATHASSSRAMDTGSSADEQSEISDPGYGTLLPNMGLPRQNAVGIAPPRSEVSHRVQRQRRRRSEHNEDPQFTSSSLDLRQRHKSEPLDPAELTVASTGGSPAANQQLQRNVPQLFHTEESTRPGLFPKVQETRPGPFQKLYVSTPRQFLQVPEAIDGSDQEEESSDSGVTARPLSRGLRGPSLVMETLRRAKHRDRNWCNSVADSVDFYSDSQSDLSDTDDQEIVRDSAKTEPDKDRQEHRTSEEHDFSKLSLDERDDDDAGHPRTGGIQLTEDPSNPSDPVHPGPPVDSEGSLVQVGEMDTSADYIMFNFERSDSQDFPDSSTHGEDPKDARDLSSPWPLTAEGFMADPALYDGSHTPTQPLMTDIFLEIVNNANQRRRLTKAELRRIRSIQIDSTTTVSEV